MKYAKSMYLGGDIIAAEECNFESSRNYGLICPLCSEAVYIRSGSIRHQTLRNGKKRVQLVNPYFAHYHTGVEFQDYCENRVHTKEGRDRMEQIRIEAKNQRLKLFNNHLWEMMQEDRNIKPYQRKNQVKRFGKDFFIALAVYGRETWSERIDHVYEKIDDWLSSVCQAEDFDDYMTKYNVLRESLSDYFPHLDMDSEFLFQKRYFLNYCDVRIHKQVCQEIADFLTARSSGYFWEKFCQTWAMMPYFGGLQPEIFQRPDMIVDMGVGMLCATHWIDQINKRLNPEESYA